MQLVTPVDVAPVDVADLGMSHTSCVCAAPLSSAFPV